MKNLRKPLLAGALLLSAAGGALALSATAASADVVCNRYGDCWRVKEHYTTYPDNLGVVFHDDAWREQHRRGHYHWRRDRDDDHGYYMRGRWHPFEH